MSREDVKVARDVLYVVEHKRDGEWRRHIGADSISFLESLAMQEAAKIRREFPEAEVRVWPYIPSAEPAAPQGKDEKIAAILKEHGLNPLAYEFYRTEFAIARAAYDTGQESGHIPFCDSPCGHSSQYAWSGDGGKTIVCLLCERAAGLELPGAESLEKQMCELWKENLSLTHAECALAAIRELGAKSESSKPIR